MFGSAVGLGCCMRPQPTIPPLKFKARTGWPTGSATLLVALKVPFRGWWAQLPESCPLPPQRCPPSRAQAGIKAKRDKTCTWRRARKTGLGRAAAERAALGRGPDEPRGASTLSGRRLGPGRGSRSRESPVPGVQNESWCRERLWRGRYSARH